MKGIIIMKKIGICIFSLAIYVGMPLAILIDLIDFDFKFYALTIGAVIVYIFLKLMGFNNQELGISKNNLMRSLKRVLPFTIVLAILGGVLWMMGFSRITPNEDWYFFFFFYIFISSPIQEFLYRGALPAIIEKYTSNYYARLIISTALYSFVHIIYKDVLTLALTFVIGIIWFRAYDKDRNLFGVSISHAILGLVTIAAGIIN